MDEISENLKRTIKKYNEVDADNDLSIIESVENEDSKYNQRDSQISNNKLEDKNEMKNNNFSNSNMSNIVKETKKVIDGQTGQSNRYNNTNNPNINYNLNSIQGDSISGYSPSRNIKINNLNSNSNFSLKAKKILDGLDSFNNNVNRDFKEIEDMIDNMIEKELKDFKK